MKKSIKVMVVDDSAVVRKVITEVLETDHTIRVIATASDPIFAMRHLEKHWPDVIILDVEMPRMDGITFLRKLMSEKPVPVIICSSLTEKNADTTIQALSAGALDILTKPKIGLKAFIQEERLQFIHAVKSAANVNISKLKRNKPIESREPPKVEKKNTADVVISPVTHTIKTTTERVVAIGTSTGGTQALEEVLIHLPRVCVGMVIVQHMPEKFTQAFAHRLNSICDIEVLEARNGDRVIPGRALIAPGGRHMMLKRNGAQYVVEVIDGPLVNRHRPSVDVLFRSVAKHAGKNAMGIIMTGMGDDGANGLLEMYKEGSLTIAQDEGSCIVFGMPKEAIKKGAVSRITTLSDIANQIVHFGHGADSSNTKKAV
jgi:two-component system chemotaxis response regulator CheB